MKIRNLLASTALCVAAGGNAWATVCDLQWSTSLYGPNMRPTHDYAAFVGGNLGIVTGTLDSSFLFIAWRRINGFDIPAATVPTLVDAYGCKKEIPSPSWLLEPADLSSAMSDWAKARHDYSDTTGPLALDRIDSAYWRHAQGDYPDYLNCSSEAFWNAARVLRSRVNEYPDQKSAFRDWVRAQDAVFANCRAIASLPDAAAENDPDWLKRDRAYQRAAAIFYQGRHADAVIAFDAIAKDMQSQWRLLAPYISARALIRRGLRNQTQSKEDLAQADARLMAILADPALASIHSQAAALRGFVAARVDPRKRIAQLDKDLSGPAWPRDALQTLTDHGFLLEKLAESPLQELEFTHWIRSLRNQGEANAQWRQHRTSAWLVAAMAMASDGPLDEELLAAAARVPDSSPAAPTLRYHQARLLIGAGRHEEARIVLQSLERFGPARLPAPSSNLVRALKLPLARNLREWTDAALRTPDPRLQWRTISLDSDATGGANFGMPVEVLARLSRAPGLPATLRDDLVIMSWTRAILLDRHDLARELAPRLRNSVKGIGPRLDSYLSAKDQTEMRARAALLLAAFPGMIIDLSPGLEVGSDRSEFAMPVMRRHISILGSRTNWWCKEWGARAKAVPAPLPFLTQAQRNAVVSEQERLNSLTNGTDDLFTPVLAWAKMHPADKDLPKALHMLVRSSRGGCITPETKNRSKHAFRHLRAHFKQSQWTAKTPYYYGYWGN